MQTDGQTERRTNRQMMQAVVTCSLRLVFSLPVSQTLPPSLLPDLVQYRTIFTD